MKNLNLLFADAKDFLSNEVNRVFLAVIIFSLVIGYMVYNNNSAINKSTEVILKSNEEVLKALENSNTEIIQAVNDVEDKVDFRYFNTTKSLEKIHNVEINTKTGELKK